MGHKYRAKPQEIDGIRFASKREAKRYSELKLLQKAGQIKDLELQPGFQMVVNGTHVCNYIADFRYEEAGNVIYEDAKGVRTPVYKLKIKLLRALYPNADLREV